MNRTPAPALRSLLLCTLLLPTSCLLARNVYWAVDGSPGGSGEWNTTTPNWNTNSAGTGDAIPWDNSVKDEGHLRGDGGTINVTEVIDASRVFFNASGNYALDGEMLRFTSAEGLRLEAANTGNITVGNALRFMTSTVGNQNFTINNNSAATLTLDGGIGADFGSVSPTGEKVFALGGSGAGATTILNGSIGTLVKPDGSGGTARLQVNMTGAGAQAIINSDNSETLTNATSGQIVNGTVLLGNANGLGTRGIQIGVSSTSATSTAALLTNQSGLEVTNNVSLGGANTNAQLIVGGNTAGTSTYSGQISAGNGSQTLRLQAAKNGRVNFTNNVIGGGTGKIVIQGQGVVALSNETGVTHSRAVDVDSGTLHFTNISGSGTGTGNNSVTVKNGAALGGTGISTSNIFAQGASSRFYANDLTNNALGIVRFHGGLTGDEGATFAFNIDGAENDTFDFGSSSVSLGGTVYLDFNAIGSGIVISQTYSLFTGSGDWTNISANFIALGDYELDSSYGDNGIYFNAATNSFSVRFAVPEPSTYAAILGLVLAGVVALRGRRTQRRAAC